jgi:parvulin-like peptidyl-prolyl isomerase
MQSSIRFRHSTRFGRLGFAAALFCSCVSSGLIAGCNRSGEAPLASAAPLLPEGNGRGGATGPTSIAPESEVGIAGDGSRLPERGRWRLVPPEQLGSVVLWPAHILIRYNEVVNPHDVSFTLTGWQSPLPPATRTRQEALLLAEQTARQAQQHPERFAELAQQLSEDPTTSQSGGSLGGVMASQLAPWPELLDTLASTKSGGVSGVVETEYGFHIVQHRVPPPAELVSGSSIVVAYDDAPFSQVSARGELPKRSRVEALHLATALYERARVEPESFEAHAREKSEHLDGERGGDFGAWSTRDLTPLSKEVEVLQGLKVGEVAPPVDTMFGYRVIKRTPNRPRQERAMARIELRFDSSLPDTDPGSRKATEEKARSLAVLLAADPKRFSELQREYCCKVVARVIEGRYLAPVEAALARLEIGEVSRTPVPFYGGYMIIQRVDPSLLTAPPTTSFDLPSPAEPDLAYLLRVHDASFVENHWKVVGEQAQALLGLAEPVSGQLLHEHEMAGQLQGKSPAEKLKVLEEQQARIQKLLEPTQHVRYRQVLNQSIEPLLFNAIP